jgi:drug/metabolite transporter (DMT)-like permease
MAELPTNKKTRLIHAILWMVGALLSFSTMAVSARQLSIDLHPLQIVLLRSGVALVIILVIVGRRGFRSVATQRLPFHFFRNIIHFFGNLTWIVGVTLIPLADVFALEFTIPIWTAILAVWFLNEQMTRGKIVALVAGFAGILIIVRPGFSTFEFGTLMVLASAFFFAITHACTKSLSSTESAVTVIFYMFIIQVPIGFIGAMFVWEMPQLHHTPWILLIGISALTAHYCVVNALRLVDATVVLPIDFLRMPMIAVVGFLFYAEPLSAFTFAGAILIFGGVYYNLVAEGRAAGATIDEDQPKA